RSKQTKQPPTATPSPDRQGSGAARPSVAWWSISAASSQARRWLQSRYSRMRTGRPFLYGQRHGDHPLDRAQDEDSRPALARDPSAQGAGRRRAALGLPAGRDRGGARRLLQRGDGGDRERDQVRALVHEAPSRDRLRGRLPRADAALDEPHVEDAPLQGGSRAVLA